MSATRPKDSILKTGLETKNQLQKRTKLKSKIKIYVDGKKYYIDHSAAYALGLIKTRAIMLDKPKLVEISSEIHNKLKSNNEIEIEYEKIEKKQSLRIYVDGSQYCLDNSAAYALGFLNVEQFNNPSSDHYYITQEIIDNLKDKYDIEYYSLKLEQESSSKKI